MNLEQLIRDMHAGPTMHYQPICRLDDGRPVGFEALARPAGSNPGEWFECADLHNLRAEAEVSAIASAIRGLPLLPGGTYLSVNALPSTVMSETFIDAVAAVSHRLVVEITEHEAVAVAAYPDLRAQLARIRRSGIREGVRLGIDDVGAGYATLRHLVELDPDVIKLDVSFTSGIQDDRRRRALVAAFVTFAAEVQASLVAEGVETETERRTLQLLGVAYGQGWLLGRPASLVAAA